VSLIKSLIKKLDAPDRSEIKFVEANTSNLHSRALDWAVGEAIEQGGIQIYDIPGDGVRVFGKLWSPSSAWEVGGIILQDWRVSLVYQVNYDLNQNWIGCIETKNEEMIKGRGRTMLEAGCRCIVRKELGDRVKIPQIYEHFVYIP